MNTPIQFATVLTDRCDGCGIAAASALCDRCSGLYEDQLQMGASDVPLAAVVGPDEPDEVLACQLCGCAEDLVCSGGCWWVATRLCSSCVLCGQLYTASAAKILDTYRDGDEQGWDDALAWLRIHHADRLARLRADVLAQGRIVDPIWIGVDGRVWDGHHRIAIAAELHLQVPFVIVWARS